MLASTSWERGLAIRATSLSTLLFTAFDLFRYSVTGMLSDFWHTFCRGDPRCGWTMARAETPFLFVPFVGVRRKGEPRDREIASVDVAATSRSCRATFLRG